MNKLILFIAFFLNFSLACLAQRDSLPNWFLTDLEQNIGTWYADNTPHMSAQETNDTYAMEWKWGIGKTSIIGRLYAMKDGKEVQDFWQFRQYWDNEKQVAVVQQFGGYGMTGIGHLKPIEDGYTESIQTFSLPDGKTWEEKHLTKMEQDQFTTQSFDLIEKKWVANRIYIWEKQTTK